MALLVVDRAHDVDGRLLVGIARREPIGQKSAMGMVYVDVEVERDGEAEQTVRFLVDSGALYSVLPHDVWQALGLTPTRRMDFVLADGTTIERSVSHCFFTYRGIRAPSPVVLGEPGDDALLGTITLENLGLVLNPFDRTLRPIRARLGTVRPMATAAAQ